MYCGNCIKFKNTKSCHIFKEYTNLWHKYKNMDLFGGRFKHQGELQRLPYFLNY